MGKMPAGFVPFGKGGKPKTGAASIPPAQMKKGVAMDKAEDAKAKKKSGNPFAKK